MSSFNHTMKSMVYGTVISLLTIPMACTVQSLYPSSKVTADGAPDIRKKLLSIAIDRPADYTTQLVRNRLIYLLSGGSGQSVTPVYKLALNVSLHVQQAVHVNISDGTDSGGRPSTGRVTAISAYVLKDIRGNPLLVRRCSVTSSFDRPRQEYANLQAEQDAKKRAAEELAERIFLSLAGSIGHR